MAEALYRKYRPQVFEDVVGQEPIERTLKNAISQDKVSHAYLFCGPRGTGKTTTARLLAKALLCEKGPTPDPDGTCEDCRLVADGAHPDVYELDAASRTGVENVREEIISRVHFAPTRGRYKVYIIDEVHMLSTAAFNALLKTLEEPPSHVVFILCTTDPQKVPETIHSRCQRFDFHRISPESMVARLGAICIAEEVEFEGEALDLIAQRADGGLRNALTSLEQIIAFENGKVTLAGAERLLGSIDSNDLVEIMAYVGKRDIANCFKWTASYVETGADLAQFVRDMAEHVRNLYVMALVGDDAELEVSETARRQLAGELAWFGADRAARLLGVLGDLMAELKTTSNPRLAFEVALTRMVRPDSDLTLEALAERVEALESGYSAVAHVLPGEPVGGAGASAAAGAGDLSVPESSDALRSEAAQPSLRASGDSGTAGMGASASSAAGAGDLSVPESSDALRSEAAQPSLRASGDSGTAGSGASGADGGSSEGRLAGGGAGGRVASLSNPAALQRVWQAAMVAVKKQKAAHGVLFMNVKAMFDEASGRIRVVFPAEASFAFNAVQKPDVQDALAEALAKAVGEPVAFGFEQESAGAAGLGSALRAEGERKLAPTHSTQPGQDIQSARESSEVRTETAPESLREGGELDGRQQDSREAESQCAGSRGSDLQRADSREAGSQCVGASFRSPSARSADSPTSAATARAERQSLTHDAPASEVFLDGASYEGVPYEPVPYDEIDGGTGASPVEPGVGPDGAAEEDPMALQALLQASFGDGVVLSEAED